MDQPNVIDDARLHQLYAGRIAARSATPACVSPEAILAVVQREGTEEARLATLEHVMSCPACHREYQWLAAVDQAGLEAEGGSSGQRRAWWGGMPMALAASLVAVLGVGVLVSNLLQRGPEPTRGAGGDIALVAPSRLAPVSRPLAFTWRSVSNAPRYVLEIQRPDGTIVLADTTADTTFVMSDPGQRLPESTYRWWVREVTDGSEPRSSAFRDLTLTGR